MTTCRPARTARAWAIERDALGQPVSIEGPEDQHWQITHNDLGLNLEIALEPDALHRETQRRLSGGEQSQTLILERGYTHLGQLDPLTLRSPNTTSQQSYQYDALGRMSFRSLQGDPAEKVIAYSYDAAGRLIGSQHGDNAHRYSVDAAGNRLEQGVDKQQGLTDNRLTQLNGTRYDGAGNLIERQQPNGERLTLGYDGANRLAHLIHASELGDTREATYRYDGLGRRISKTVRDTNGTTATTHYGWDGDRIVREDTDNQRTTVVYEPGSFVPILRIDDTQQGQLVSAYITDALGTPMQLVTPNGQPRWLAEPDDWAAVTKQRAVRGVTQPIRFQGQWRDEESGLYYNRHRYYDPQQGRYISQDPIGLKGGTNLYGYVTNPISMVDPLGLSSRPYGLGGGPYSQSNRISRSVEQAESATKSCSVSSNHLIGFGQGVASVIGGNVNFLRTLSRNVGLLDREEMRRVTIEGNTIDEAARLYASNDFVREEANSRVKDYCGEGFMAGRAFMGTLTGLGPTALYGDVSVAVEDLIKENPHVESEEVVYRALEAMFHGN